MLERVDFDRYHPGTDNLSDMPTTLRLTDLQVRFKGKPKVSYLISTYNRKSQLARALECLCRQDFREFEVLLMDDGSTQNMADLSGTFAQYLNLRTFHMDRGPWHSCPSRGFRAMLPYAQGEVIAIGHPEMMLAQKAMWYLYHSCTEITPNTYYSLLTNESEIHGTPVPSTRDDRGEWYWVTLKPGFIPNDPMQALDRVDWHTDTNAIHDMSGYSSWGPCFAGQPNPWHAARLQYPWWFVGAAKRDCPIWKYLPVSDGHGTIDMWLISSRKVNGVVDAIPNEVLCYHQAHQTSAVSPRDESQNMPPARPFGQEVPQEELKAVETKGYGFFNSWPSDWKPTPAEPDPNWLPDEIAAGKSLYSARIRASKRGR